MFTKQQFDELLAQKSTLVIDGGLATELEKQGHDLNHPLWSGKILQEDPAAIENVHVNYWLAGADIAITASYQAATKGLQEHFHLDASQANDLVKRSVTCASTASFKVRETPGFSKDRKLLIAGSVGPYGAYLSDGSEYRGDYSLTPQEFKSFHRPRIQALVESGNIDLLALETIPSIGEIQALLQLLKSEFPSAIAWVSCTVKDDDHISDGTSFADVLKVVNQHAEQVVAVGLNCCPPDRVTAQLRSLSQHTSLPLLCYPNSGEVYHADGNHWTGTKLANKSGEYANQWRQAGARLIGGCCRTGPEDIECISNVFVS